MQILEYYSVRAKGQNTVLLQLCEKKKNMISNPTEQDQTLFRECISDELDHALKRARGQTNR